MSRLARLAPFLALALPACATDTPSTASSSQSISHHDDDHVDVPAALAVAADQRLAFELHAVGTQDYKCAANATGYAWAFVAPDANLYRGDDSDEPVGHHFAGPTWEYKDGSFVVGKKVAAVTVDPTAIPWLLLVAASHGGPDGRMTAVTTIQRLDTEGGLAPADGCDADHVGASAMSIYTARYYFYVTRGLERED